MDWPCSRDPLLCVVSEGAAGKESKDSACLRDEDGRAVMSTWYSIPELAWVGAGQNGAHP